MRASASRDAIEASVRDSSSRILNKNASGSEPIKFFTGVRVPKDAKYGRKSSTERSNTPGTKSWQRLSGRDVVDNPLAHALGMHDPRYRTHISPKSRKSGVAEDQLQHKLGFEDTDKMPIVMELQKLFDAFQDTTRSGPLPYGLDKGSMPLYFPMNRKYLESFSHHVVNPPDPKNVWDLSAGKQGPFEKKLEQQHGKSRFFDTSLPANSPALEDRRGGQDYLSTFMTERTNFDGTTRARTPSSRIGTGTGMRGKEITRGFVGNVQATEGGAEIMRIPSAGGSEQGWLGKTELDNRPSTSAASLGGERFRSQTHNAHDYPRVPSWNDKVLRGKRTDDLEIPDWHVCRSQTKGFPYWYNRKTGESRWLRPDAASSTRSMVQEQRLSREDPAGGHDRIWFNYQPGYEANQEIHGTGHTTYDTMMELHTKNDYLIQEQQGYKKCLQRRYAKTPDTELQSMRWLGTSYPPAGKTQWEDKLFRLISDKCYSNSGPNYQMRKAFFALDEDRSGSIEIDELGGVLQKWINLELTEEQLEIIKAKFDNGSGIIYYKDLCKAIEDAGHPLGGAYNINGVGSHEKLLGTCKEKLISHRAERSSLVGQ